MEIHNEFLDLNYRYQYYLLELVADHGDYYLTVNRAMKLLGLSKFKLSQYVETVNADLAMMSPESYLRINGDGIFESGHISESIVRKIRLDYLQQSNLFKMFEFSLLNPGKNETTDFCDALFIGKTKFYELRKEMVEVADHFNLQFKKNQLIGPEMQIRQFVFEIYYSYFNGIEKPLALFQETVDQMLVTMRDQFQINLLPTTITKLETYLKVQSLRLRGKNALTAPLLAPDFKTQQPQLWQPVLSMLTTNYQLLRIPLEVEAEGLLTFLFTESYVPLEIDYLTPDLKNGVSQKTGQFVNKVEHILMKDEAHSEQAQNILANLAHDLDQIHAKHLTFYTEPTTFIDEQQLTYFAEANPLFHQIILTFTTKQETDLDWRKQASLYYDYMFACIEDIPLEILKDRVYICVDFSQGRLYNQYMKKTVNYFNNLNIEVQTTVDERTDLYLSDFYSSTLTCEQLIWKNPPTILNWQQFGDLVVAIKKVKL